MDAISNYLTDSGLPIEIMLRVIQTVVVIGVLVIGRRLLQRVINNRVDEVEWQYRGAKTLDYTIFIIGIFLIGRMWFPGLEDVATYLGLLSAGVALALRDPITNLAGWLYLISKRPFALGDRIEVGNHAGDVVDSGIWDFTLLEIGNWVDAEQSTGRIIQIPNSVLFTSPIANYTKGFTYLWNEVPVLVTFDSDWKLAKRILLDIIERHDHISSEAREEARHTARRLMIRYRTLSPTVYTNVEASGIELTMRYICKVRERRTTTHELWEQILTAFEKEPSIDLAYPSQTFYVSPLADERKPTGAGDVAGLT